MGINPYSWDESSLLGPTYQVFYVDVKLAAVNMGPRNVTY